MGDLQQIPTWLDTPPIDTVLPPTCTRKQDLPFGDLTWESFERLCLRLARREADVEHCQLYGVHGDKQEGIDIFARTELSAKYRVYQCKREAKFGPAKIKKAVETFLNGDWRDKSDTLVLCTKESLKNSNRSDAFEKQFDLLKRQGIALVPWDSHQLSLELKKQDHYDLVDEFFGREWVRQFLGEDVAVRFNRRLAPQQVVEYRQRLGDFYRKVFNSQDPGMPMGELSERAVLPIEKRFVFPDVIARRSIGTTANGGSSGSDRPRETKPDTQHYASPDSARAGNRHAEGSGVRTIDERTAIDSWLATAERVILLGVPGSGKSTLLRFSAIDMLQHAPQMEQVCRRWGRHLPVWVPFAFWTKTIANRQEVSSLSEVIRQWFQSFNEERLWPLVEAAIDDDRLLLLVDGLDEWQSKESAALAISQLQVFVEQRNVPLVATSRPRGFRMLSIPTDQWQVAQIADFSTIQQKRLVATWFAHSNHEVNDEQSRSPVNSDDRFKLEADKFLTELERSHDLRELAKIPLLLLLLIYHRLQRSALPDGRFKAYESMVAHLVATQPHRRRVSASVQFTDPELTDDDVTRALAHVAYYLQSNDTGGAIDQRAATSVLEDFLRDDQRGFGFNQPDARRFSRRLLDIGEGETGLLVRRSNHELGFFHRTFQEYLAAFHLSYSTFEEQTAVVKHHSGNPQWHETLMCLLYLTRRPMDLLSFVEAIESKYAAANVSGQHEIEATVAEIAFGSVRCPPECARRIAESTFVKIERGDWMPQRERLLRIALNGCRATVIKELIKKKITEWFPCRIKWRSGIYESMARWPISREVVDCLWNGIHDEDIWNQRSAAQALCHLADGDHEIGDDFARHACKDARPSLRAVSLEALINGWPNHRDLPEAIASARRSLDPDLRVVAIFGRIKCGQHCEADRSDLLDLATRGSTLCNFGDLLVPLLINGWPQCETIKKTCLDGAVNEHGARQIDRSVAMRVLMEAFPGDVDVAKLCVREIQNEKFPFITLPPGYAFPRLAEVFAGNVDISNAVDDWLEKQRWTSHDVYDAALLTRSERAKRKLLSLMNNDFPFWSVAALLDIWGPDDDEIREPLKEIAFGDNAKAACIGSQLPTIIRDTEECRKRLVELLHDNTVRPDLVFRGLVELSAGDCTLVDVAAEQILSRTNISETDLASVKAILISRFPDDARVRKIARDALAGRLRDLGSPSIECIANAYRDDREFRNRVIQIASPLPERLREVAVSQLRSSLLEESFGLELFGACDLEENAEIKTEATLAYCERLKSFGLDLNPTLRNLTESICCYGPDHQARRQAAFCGLVELQRLDLMRDAVETIGDSRLCAINLYSPFAHGPNIPLVHCILTKWEAIKLEFGETFWARLSKSPASPNPWEYLWGFADQHMLPCQEAIEHIESMPTKSLDAIALQFVARARPRSKLLMQCCLETLQIDDDKVDVSGEAAVTAADILGSHFPGNEGVVERILSGGNGVPFYSKKLLAICEISPEHDLLRTTYKSLDKYHGRFADEVHVRLVCRIGTTTEVEDLIARLCAARRLPFVSQLLFCKPITRRIASDSDLSTKLLSRLQASPSPSEKGSFSRLITASIGYPDGFRDWAESELLNQLADPEVGMDVMTGELRPVRHAILDSLIAY